MHSAVLSHSPSGQWTWVPYHFFSEPGPGNDLCPCVNFRAYSVTLRAFAIQCSFFPRLVQSMSLYIDMKMILPLNCSGSPFDFVIIFWILSSIHNVVNPGNFVHSISTGSPVDPIRTTCFPKPCNLAFRCLHWFITAASQTQHWVRKDVCLAVANWTALSVNRVVTLHIGCCQSIVVSPVISVWSVINLSVTWKNCYKEFKVDSW